MPETPKKIYDGGPAFPMTNEGIPFENGLSKREWFAGLAMQGLCASGLARAIGRSLKNPDSAEARSGKTSKDLMASIAVNQADALIAKLNEAPRANQA